MLAVGRLALRRLHRPVISLPAGQLAQTSNIIRHSSGVESEAAHPPDALSAQAMNSNTMSDRLIWVDLEMTGLDVDTDHILEMACIVTDGDMNIIAEGPDVIVHQPDSVLDSMGPWCKEQHGKSGLTEASQRSKVTLTELEDQMLSFVQKHTPEQKCPLAGNTIHMDKRFLDKYMKRFSSHLHYRIVDVSSIKELCRRWYPHVHLLAPRKKGSHRALDDIRESIQELKYYKEKIFR